MVTIQYAIIPMHLHAPWTHECPSCGTGDGLISRITRTSNRNGNAGRPYLRCAPCSRFVTFLDDRGVHDVNPECRCRSRSRMQVANRNKGRGLHYVCSTGHCTFYRVAADDSGEQVQLDDDWVRKFANLGLI